MKAFDLKFQTILMIALLTSLIIGVVCFFTYDHVMFPKDLVKVIWGFVSFSALLSVLILIIWQFFSMVLQLFDKDHNQHSWKGVLWAYAVLYVAAVLFLLFGSEAAAFQSFYKQMVVVLFFLMPSLYYLLTLVMTYWNKTESNRGNFLTHIQF